MSPKEKHIPDSAQRTSVCLTAEDRGAIRWISEVRRNEKSRRTTLNDIIVDALWYYVEKVEGKTRQEIRSTLPIHPIVSEPKDNVAQMPNPRKKH